MSYLASIKISKTFWKKKIYPSPFYPGILNKQKSLGQSNTGQRKTEFETMTIAKNPAFICQVYHRNDTKTAGNTIR